MPQYLSYSKIKNKKLSEFGHNPLSPGNPFPSYKDPPDLEDNDVPNVKDSDYVTHVPLSQSEVSLEQDEEIPPEEMQPEVPQGEVPQDINTNMPATTPGEVPPGAEIAPEEGPSSPVEVGRVFELKKIHSRLTSIEAYLSVSTDEQLTILRSNISKALELFHILISNLSLFKDKIDPIIVTFYKFLEQAYSILSQYYKDKESGKDVKISD